MTKGFSEAVIQMMLKDHKLASARIYYRVWHSYFTWCVRIMMPLSQNFQNSGFSPERFGFRPLACLSQGRETTGTTEREYCIRYQTGLRIYDLRKRDHSKIYGGDVEKPHGQINETIANGIGIVFGSTDLTDESIEKSTEVTRGEWTAIKRCSGDGYLVAAALKYYHIDKYRGSLSNIKFLCSTGEYLEGDGEKRGSFQAMSKTCPDGIDSFQTIQYSGKRLGHNWPIWSDVFFICSPPIPTNRPTCPPHAFTWHRVT
ncbi:uncharacterized protein LOC134934146 [Pseudophryne corroboree]|uniref:uncharacterized protein LOC134934146 n=1 Tax=Pseudophryne corroboree TaxID=495146 RepID=UPI00308153A0